MSTISVISALRRDDNLRGHVESGLDVGFTPTEIVEMIIQIFYYVGPIQHRPEYCQFRL